MLSGPGEAIVGRGLLDKLNLHVGDKFRLQAIGHQLVAACGRHLGIRATYAGFVHHDDSVWRAVRRRRLFMSDAPTSRAAEEIRQLTRGLVKGESMGHGY